MADDSPRSTAAPHLSVVVPCYDATATLPLTLESLYDQEGAPPTEIVIVDNRSHDDLHALVRRWSLENSADHIVDLRVVDAYAHQGTSYARNVGAAHARAQRLVFLDADDAASVRWLADAAALFERADVFCGSAISVAGEEFVRPLSQIRALIEAPDVPLGPFADQRTNAFPVLMGADLCITRALFLSLGGFDQSLPLAGEDNELALRLRQHGREISTSPAFRIAYRQRHVPAAVRAESRRAAAAHVLNAARYGTLRRSPVVGGRHLFGTTLRPLRTLLRALPRPSIEALRAAANDASLARGAWEGLWRYRIVGKPPEPCLGVGFDEGPGGRPGEEADR